MATQRTIPTMERLLAISSLSTFLTTVVMMLKGKVTAQLLGPVGVGISAEIQQVVSLAMVPLAFASGPALVKAVGEHKSGAIATARRFVLLGGLLATFAAVGLGVATLDSSEHLPDWLAICAAAAVVGALTSIDSQVLIARARLKDNGILTVAQALATAVLGVAGTFFWGLDGQFVATLLGFVVVFPLGRRLVRTEALEKRDGGVDWPFARSALLLGASGLVSALLAQSMWTYFRTLIHQVGGAEANGQLQAARVITITYFGVALQALGNVVFPSYAQATDRATLEARIEHAGALVLRFVPALLFLGISLRGPIVHALFSAEFDEAAKAAGLQMASDMAKGAAWVLGGALLFKGRLRAFVAAEIIATVILTALGGALATRLGVTGIAVAHVAGYSLSLLTNAIILRLELGLAFPRTFVIYSLAWTAALTSAAVLLERYPSTSVLAIGASAIWFGLLLKPLFLAFAPASWKRRLPPTP